MTMMEQDKPLVRTRRRFTKEFKADAAALVLDGEQSIAQVARDLGIGETNLGELGSSGPYRPRRQTWSHDRGTHRVGAFASGEQAAPDGA